MIFTKYDTSDGVVYEFDHEGETLGILFEKGDVFLCVSNEEDGLVVLDDQSMLDDVLYELKDSLSEKSMKLDDYIMINRYESKSDFARSQGVERQQVNKWAERIVVNDFLYSKRRQLKVK